MKHISLNQINKVIVMMMVLPPWSFSEQEFWMIHKVASELQEHSKPSITNRYFKMMHKVNKSNINSGKT